MGRGMTTKRKRTSTGTPTPTSSARGGARKREVVTPLGPSSETTALRAWAEVDLGAIAGNIQTIRHLLSRSCRLMSVVKADAYGHGVVPVCRAALAAGAAWLGVATLGEGVARRLGGIEGAIMVLGGVTACGVTDAAVRRLSIGSTSAALAEVALCR